MRMRSSGIAAALILACITLPSPRAHAREVRRAPDPAEETAAAPRPRCCMGLAYDAKHQEVVLFGGEYNGLSLGDTWTWDGSAWTRHQPVDAPRRRWNPSMAYDAAREEVVLFGGYQNKFLRDTWTWDGETWTKATPSHSPSPREAAAMA